jgi:hypothetical protein
MKTEEITTETGRDSSWAPYQDPAEHIADLMTRLDLLLLKQVFMQRNLREPVESWMGFVAISDKEVDALLEPAHRSRIDQGQNEDIKLLTRKIENAGKRIQERVHATEQAGLMLPMMTLARIFGLNLQEMEAITACLAPEVDPKYERLYGYLHDDMSRKRPTLGLISTICSASVKERMKMRRIFSPFAPLLKYQLLTVDADGHGGQPFSSRSARVDERIYSFLIGETDIASDIKEAVEWAQTNPPANLHGHHAALTAQLLTAVEKCCQQGCIRKKPIFYLFGLEKTGKGALAGEISRRLGMPLMTADAGELEDLPTGFNKAVFLVVRESLLNQSALYIKNIDTIIGKDGASFKLKALMKRIEEMGGITFLSGAQPWPRQIPGEPFLFLPVEVSSPGYEEQLNIWKGEVAESDDLREPELMLLASKYPSTVEQVQEAFQIARNRAMSHSGATAINAKDLEYGLRTRALPDFGSLAKRIETRHGWSDLVLPAVQMERLHDLCTHITHRVEVYGTWGFGKKLSLGKGLNVLFCGPPGTGKTMAAGVVAHELGLDLYKIDLSQVVSKYICDREKNLHQIFRQAQTSNSVLFFDEADALLGKRSEVKDSHDRYANLEIAYLLQKMEEYEGVTILASNLRQNMDEAFTRRIRFIIEFPFPDVNQREKIWRTMFPSKTPLAPSIDFVFLSERAQVAGGNIKNIALASAFSAAAQSQPISMKHLLGAVKQEYQKIGKPFVIRDFEPYARELEEV